MALREIKSSRHGFSMKLILRGKPLQPQNLAACVYITLHCRMQDNRTDEMLMLSYRDGNALAFETLYGRWRGKLYRYLLRQCGSPAYAEELYQDIWLKIIGARAGYEVTAKFSTWLFRIAHNRLVDHYRHHAGEVAATYQSNSDDTEGEDDYDPLATLVAPRTEQPEVLLERKALALSLVRHIDALPAAQRETFMLSEEAEMTLEEIAAATGVSRETAKSRLRYAVSKLRQQLKELR